MHWRQSGGLPDILLRGPMGGLRLLGAVAVLRCGQGVRTGPLSPSPNKTGCEVTRLYTAWHRIAGFKLHYLLTQSSIMSSGILAPNVATLLATQTAAARSETEVSK